MLDLGDSTRAVSDSAGLGAAVQVGESEERSLAEDLASIEAILRGEAGEGTEPGTAPAAESDEDVWDDLEEDGQDPADLGSAGLELTREEMEAFLEPTEDEASSVAQDPAADHHPHEASADRPPTWFKDQVADLADLVQGLALSARALRESREEDGQDLRSVSAENLEQRTLTQAVNTRGGERADQHQHTRESAERTEEADGLPDPRENRVDRLLDA